VLNRFVRGVRALPRRSANRFFGTLVRVQTRSPAAALTFNDGPDPIYTPRLLEVLEKHGAAGTFFMIGEQAAAHADLVRAVGKGGHAVANHGWDHARFPEISVRECRTQVRRCAEAIRPYGQRFFRPPQSLQSVRSYLAVRSMGYECVSWSTTVTDWLTDDADQIASRMIEMLKPGRIVLLHDGLHAPRVPGAEDRSAMIDAVDIALNHLRSFSFVTLQELLRLGRPVRFPWFIRSELDWERRRTIRSRRKLNAAA
jgi:peptidoglycan/xylan/chitin deacetylase (PgdA/CDA1 family)